MADDKMHDIPAKCPITGEPLYVSELTSEETGVTIRGKFRVPKVAMIDPAFQEFLEIFLRSRGVISTVEKELGISYPTARAKLDAMLEAMDMKPFKEERRNGKAADHKRKILQQLEEGKITPEEAKRKLRGSK